MGMSSKEYDCITYFDLELRMTGHREYQKRQDALFREIAYNAFFAPYQDPKKLKNFKREQFWPIYTSTPSTKIDSQRRSRLVDIIKLVNDA